jgi:hypothetical protein
MTGQPLTDALRRALHRRTPTGRTVAELLVEIVMSKALSGDIRFIRFIFEVDREESVARQAVEPTADRIDINMVRDQILAALGDNAETRIKVAEVFRRIAEGDYIAIEPAEPVLLPSTAARRRRAG